LKKIESDISALSTQIANKKFQCQTDIQKSVGIWVED